MGRTATNKQRCFRCNKIFKCKSRHYCRGIAFDESSYITMDTGIRTPSYSINNEYPLNDLRMVQNNNVLVFQNNNINDNNNSSKPIGTDRNSSFINNGFNHNSDSLNNIELLDGISVGSTTNNDTMHNIGIDNTQNENNVNNTIGHPNNLVTNSHYNVNLNISSTNAIYNRQLPPGFFSIYKIYDILNQARVPFYLHDKLIETIGHEIVVNGFDPFDPDYKRKTFIKHLCNRFKTPEPQIYPLHLESHLNTEDHDQERLFRDTVEVVCFDFVEQLKDLLSDINLFGNLDNLVINNNPNNPDEKWLPYKNNSGTVYETLDGKWYQDYVTKTNIDIHKNFVIPIGLYIDASETVTYQRYSFQPLIMFPLILNLQARSKLTSSRVIALIPDLEAKSSAVKAYSKMTQSKTGMAIRNYHSCMNVALKSLIKAQTKGVDCFVRLGNDIRYKNCLVPVAFILGDAKSQDTLCGRYGGHKCPRMCRACDVNYENSDDTNIKCNYITPDYYNTEIGIFLDSNATRIAKKEAIKVLHKLSQHAVLNAFNDVDLGINPRGILGATPHDLMHLFLEGILKYSTRIFCDSFVTKQKAELDLFVDKLFGQHRSSEKINMLRTNFTKGMTNLTMLTADEQAGIALTLLCIAQTKTGQQLLSHSFVEDLENGDDASYMTDESCNTSTESDANLNINNSMCANKQQCTYNDFLQIIEVLLSFHAWYKSTVPIIWNSNSKNIIRQSIKCMLEMLKKVLPRATGNGWKLQKFHEHLHLP
jgi:Plavaka transposase